MEGRCRFVIFFAALAIMLGTFQGFSKDTKGSLKTKPTNELAGQTGSYTVRPGDTLYHIASTHGTTAYALKSTNHLKSDVIQVGQKLKVPVAPNKASKVIETAASEGRPIKKLQLSPQPSKSLKDQGESTENQPLRQRIVEAGFQFLDVRYHRGGEDVTGFDCSGLVKKLFSEFDINLPRTSREQFRQGEKVDRDKLEKGDLVFFSSGGTRPTHVGIYIGDNKFLHAALKAGKVIVSDLNKIWYSMRYLGARRIIWGNDPSPESQN